MSALYPVKEDARSEKKSIVNCEFNSPIGNENEYDKTITSFVHILEQRNSVEISFF